MRILVACLLLGWSAYGLWAQASVRQTVHNLSRSGPGTYKSLEAEDPCSFCHVPHTAKPKQPLWGHKLSQATYQMYTSPTLNSTPTQPNGSSRLCLACHDGTLALGELHQKDLPLGSLPAQSPGFLGTDLSGTHPISFSVTPALIEANNQKSRTLKPLEAMKSDPDGVCLDGENRMQCTSCHDPHKDLYYPATGIHFWRKPTFSEVCLVCHLP